MKREIKFRAWNAKDKLMSDPFDIFRGTQIWRSKHESAITYASVMRDYEIMQYTGLNDLNAQEIFEGDIIVAYNAEQTGVDDEQGEIMANVTGKVFFEDGAFHYDGHSAGAIPLNYNIQDIEVIGNIFENPELIDFNITEK